MIRNGRLSCLPSEVLVYIIPIPTRLMGSMASIGKRSTSIRSLDIGCRMTVATGDANSEQFIGESVGHVQKFGG